MKVTITGAAGFIGSYLVSRFLAKGDQVTGIDRAVPGVHQPCRMVQARLGDPVSPDVFQGTDLVIHAIHDRNQGAFQANLDGTRSWFTQAHSAGVTHQLFLTSVSAHADSPSEYGRIKYELERFFIENGGLAIRAGLVVGNGGTFGDMVRLIRRFPVVPVLGGDRLQVVLTDLKTVGDVILKYRSLGTGRIADVFQPEWVGLARLSRQICKHFRRPNVIVPFPLAVAKSLLQVAECIGLPPTMSLESLLNLEHVRFYGYVSSYPELGLRIKTLEEMLEDSWKERTMQS